MAYKKSINHLSVSKLKSKDLIEWFIGVATWKDISNALDIGHSKVFKFKRILRGKVEQVSPFDALAETFTVKELNDLITMYNDYLENPENYKQTKKRSEIDLEGQTRTVNKHLAEMGSMQLETPNQTKQTTNVKQEDVQDTEQDAEQEDAQDTERDVKQEDVQDTEQDVEQEDAQDTEQDAEQEDAQDTEQDAEQEDAQDTEQDAEQEDAQDTEQDAEQEDVQDTEQDVEQEDVQDTERDAEQEDVQDTEQDVEQEDAPKFQSFNDNSQKSEFNFTGKKTIGLSDFWKSKKKK